MKSKRILITYLDNGNIESQVSKEALLNGIVHSFAEEGKIVNGNSVPQQGVRVVSFDDDTKIYVQPFGHEVDGMRFTHIYMDEKIMQIPMANEVIDWAYKPCLMQGEFYNYDTSEKDRMFTFSFDGKDLKLNNI